MMHAFRAYRRFFLLRWTAYLTIVVLLTTVFTYSSTAFALTTGSIRVTITNGPSGANWQIGGQGNYSSGQTVTVPTGTHTVSFSMHDGWIRPDNFNVDVQQGQTYSFSKSYTQFQTSGHDS